MARTAFENTGNNFSKHEESSIITEVLARGAYGTLGTFAKPGECCIIIEGYLRWLVT